MTSLSCGNGATDKEVRTDACTKDDAGEIWLKLLSGTESCPAAPAGFACPLSLPQQRIPAPASHQVMEGRFKRTAKETKELQEGSIGEHFRHGACGQRVQSSVRAVASSHAWIWCR